MSELQATDYPKKNTQEATKSKLSYLLAYDGSDHAKAAISLLLDLPQKSGVPPERCSVSLISVLPTQWIEGHEKIQQELLEEKQKFRELGFEVETILKAGNPAATINAHAEETQADLVIIGAKGRRATLGILLGGVAQQVVEYSSRPVLVVRAPYDGLKRLLAVVDGSESSKKAVDYLVPLCPDGSRKHCTWLPLSARMSVMHVMPPPIADEVPIRAWSLGPEALYPAPMLPIDKEALEASEQRYGEQLLKQNLRILKQGGLKSESILVRGDAASEILQIIQDKHIDLVICGSRGLSAITGWLLGSVSRKLVHYAPCSVLIVK